MSAPNTSASAQSAAPVAGANAGAPDLRLDVLRNWLASLPAAHGLRPDTLRPASSDASFRRYFRIDAADGTRVIMDAPPAKEDCKPFIHVAGLLRDAGLAVPDILEQDLPQGFLLLSDLGAQTYWQRLHESPPDAEIQSLYMGALDALVRMQGASVEGLAGYDHARLADELTLFPAWYLERHHGKTLDDKTRAELQRVFDVLIENNLAQPTVLVHRDFHSPNLMVPLPGTTAPGVLDFQDAVAGPITYDLASLVTDARFTWYEPQQIDWAIRYWEMARRAGLPVPADFADFHRDYEWMGLQRNLRILGVFARLNHRDGKAVYLTHMPRVNAYVRQVAGRYGVFKPLMRILDSLEDVKEGFSF
jgi:aminoglycoside/choline kinase family phosphotransferase